MPKVARGFADGEADEREEMVDTFGIVERERGLLNERRVEIAAKGSVDVISIE